MPTISRQAATQRPGTPTRKASILDRLEGIEFSQEEGIQLLLYGRSGTGKTTIWSTFPAPILAIVCSGGKRPGELRSIDTPENRDRIKQIKVKHSDDVKEVLQALKADPGRFKTVVLDHASGLQDRILAEILNLEELPPQKSWGMARKQDYGQCGLQCKELMRSLLSLPGTNSVIVAHEKDFSNDDATDDGVAVPFVAAGMMPSIVAWLNGSVDYICQTYIRQKESVKLVKSPGSKEPVEIRTKLKGQVEFCLRTAPDAVYMTKFRMPMERRHLIPASIVDPNYDKLMQIITS